MGKMIKFPTRIFLTAMLLGSMGNPLTNVEKLYSATAERYLLAAIIGDPISLGTPGECLVMCMSVTGCLSVNTRMIDEVTTECILNNLDSTGATFATTTGEKADIVDWTYWEVL